MRIIDISPEIDPAAVVWPGDRAYSLEPRWSIEAGDAITVNTVSTTAHVGAHIDAPAHILQGAPAVLETRLDHCIGACLVVDVSDLVDAESTPRGFAPAAEIRARIERLAGSAPVERVLLRHTRPTESRAADWDPNAPGVDPAFMDWFGARGGLLVGIDLVSFDPVESRELLAHKSGIATGTVLLEGLDLSEAPAGWAEVIALPLPWRGADASPVRAVLRIEHPA